MDLISLKCPHFSNLNALSTLQALAEGSYLGKCATIVTYSILSLPFWLLLLLFISLWALLPHLLFSREGLGFFRSVWINSLPAHPVITRTNLTRHTSTPPFFGFVSDLFYVTWILVFGHFYSPIFRARVALLQSAGRRGLKSAASFESKPDGPVYTSF